MFTLHIQSSKSKNLFKLLNRFNIGHVKFGVKILIGNELFPAIPEQELFAIETLSSF